MTGAILVGCVIAAYAYYLLRRYDLEHLRAYEAHAAAFHAAAAPLIADDETPDEVLDVLEVLNRKSSDKWGALDFLSFMARHPQVGVPRHDPDGQVIRAFFTRRPELESPYLEACASALLAMSYRSRVCGHKLRLWLSAIETSEKQERVAVSYSHYVQPMAA